MMKPKTWILGAVMLYAGFQLANKKSTPQEEPTFAEGTVLTIRLESVRVIEKNGIGDEWSFQSRTGSGETITKNGIKVDVSGLSNYTINSTAIEDDKLDDIGRSTLELTPTVLQYFKDYTEKVSVYESHGSGAGNTALCEFKYHIDVDTL